jgi:hypothetical protein
MKLNELLEQLPTDDYEKATGILEEILKDGPKAVAQLVEAVGEEFGNPEGVKPKYAVHGLVHYCSRPGADNQRQKVAQTLARLLDSDHSDELKAFICRQLQLCGRAQEVGALAKLLGNDRLCEPAAQALAAIGGERAVDALRGALSRASGKRRATIINALGRFGDKASAREIRGDVDSKNADVKLVAWYTLGNAGDTGSIEALLEAASGKPSFERTQATDACLRLAWSLATRGNPESSFIAAEKICRRLMSMRKGGQDVHDRCAALAALADVRGRGAIDDLIDAMDSSNLRLRNHAARIAVELARPSRKHFRRDTEKLLKKVLSSTEEEAVLVEAKILLAQAG